MLSIVMFETELFSCSAKQVIYTVVSSRLRSRLGRSQQFSPSPRGRDYVVSDRLTEFVNVASVIQTCKKKEAKEPFVVGANKLLGSKLGWIYLQHTRFPKVSRPVLFSSLPSRYAYGVRDKSIE